MTEEQTILNGIRDTFIMMVRRRSKGRDPTDWQNAFEFALKNPNDEAARAKVEALLRALIDVRPPQRRPFVAQLPIQEHDISPKIKNRPSQTNPHLSA